MCKSSDDPTKPKSVSKENYRRRKGISHFANLVRMQQERERETERERTQTPKEREYCIFLM